MKSKIIKFNKNQIELLNEFIKIYNIDYNGNLDSFLKNPKINYFIKNNNTELLHVFNTTNPLKYNKLMFDPLYKFNKNSDNYIMFLTMNDIQNYNCKFIISNDKLNEYKNEKNKDNYPYYLHSKLMNEYAVFYNNIDYNLFMKSELKEDELKNNTYILLCPYLYSLNEIKNIMSKNEKIIISQDIPYTESNDFNEFIFNLWNILWNNEFEN